MTEQNLISPSFVKEGILDICQYLRLELISFLQEEGRYKGRVLSYMNNLGTIFKQMNAEVTLADTKVYNQILYRLRPQIYSDFKRLSRKKLSMADRIIVIMVRILEYSKNIKTPDFRFSREQDSVLRVIMKMYDNIRNKGKLDALYSMKRLVENTIYSGQIPEKECWRLNLIDIGHPKQKVRTIIDQTELLSNTKIGIEINLKEKRIEA